MKPLSAGKALGIVIRLIACSVIFGFWQGSYFAGIFMVLFLISIDDAARIIK